MFWAGAGCRVNGKLQHDGGCQCNNYCGYTCSKECTLSSRGRCKWNKTLKMCTFRSTGKPDTKLPLVAELIKSTKDAAAPPELTHTLKKPMHQCEYCLKTFSMKQYLTLHTRTHTGEKPYKCDECGECFSQKGSLNAHMRMHTLERPYQFKECGARFTQSGALTMHMRTHTGERPYACGHCGQRFTTSGNARRHERNLHGAEFDS